MARAMPREPAATESLQSRLDSGERFGQLQLLALLHALAEPLGEAHRTGRFHGRIGPADIRFDDVGEVVLDGWGRDTTPDPVRASRYAAIECYAPVHPQGPWTDVYALGAILWRAITGGPPADVLHRKGDVSLEKLAPSGFGPNFLRTVDAALEIAPQRRPQSIDAWLSMFAPRAVGTGATAPGPAVPAKAATGSRRLLWPLLASAGLAVAIAAAWLAPEPRDVTTSAPAPVVRPTPAPAPPQLAPVRLPAEMPSVAVAIAEPTTIEVPTPQPAPAPTKPAPVKPKPVAVAAAKPPPAKVEKATPIAKPALELPPVVIPAAVEPEAGSGQAPRALLVRADKRLRRLFDDYARLRAKVERSYDDPDIPYEVKRRAYREGLSLQKELVELRDARNRIAHSGNFQTANRRFDDLEAAADQVGARMTALRRSI